MYLKALEIQGFKSFPDKTVLTFDADITAIVGPNGSGKSNISDAVRWVMGEQSTRTLRGGKMEDVIFGGTARRKQLGYAEVSLVLDNTDHILDMDQSEVMVTRRYYRSGESEYYINRRSVRLRDVNELFMDTGLGREGYSIIGQGKIDEILSVRSADRREVFEEAAGISRFRHRKEEAERKLERTDENLVRINDKIAELEIQVEPLRQQSKKAREFLALRDELRGLEISVWLESLERLRAGSIKLMADCEAAARQREEARREVERLYAAAEGYAQQMRDKDVESDRLRFETARRESSIAELSSAIAVLRSSIQHNQDNAQRIRQDLDQQEGRSDSLAQQIQEHRDRLGEIGSQLERVCAQLEEERRQADQAQEGAGKLQRELEELRNRQELERTTAAQARELLSALAAAAQEVLDRDAAVRQELSSLEEQLTAARTELDKAGESLDKAQEERDRAKNVISGYDMRAQTRRRKADETAQRHMKLQMDLNNLDGRIRMLTEMEKVYEGFSKAVKLVMGEARRGSLKGIHGPVADLIRVEPRYTVAIETALGSAMQNLVVDTEEDGKAVIQYLKRREGGRVTILPLSSIRPGQLREAGALEREPGFVGVADRLVAFEGRYANVCSNLLGRVAVMEDLDSAIAAARKYGYRFRIVTLDGQVLNPGGSMTGGSASRSAGILSRKGELEALGKQREATAAQMDRAREELEHTKREAAAADYQLQTAQEELREWESAVLKAQGEHSRCRSVYDGLTARRESLQSQLTQLEERSTSIEADTQAARSRIQELEGTAADLQSQAQGKEQGHSDLQERCQRIAARIAQLSAQQAALEAEQDTAGRAVDQLEQLRRELAGDRRESEALVSDYEEKNRALQTQIGEKEGRLEQLNREKQDHGEAIEKLTREKLELEAKRNQADKESRDKNNELLHMEREVSVLEQKKVAASMEEKQILDKLWDSYQLSHEAARKQRQELESIPKATRRIGELKRAIAQLGSINLGSIEEFDRVNQRYTYLTDQRDDVERAKTELGDVIAGITREMQTIFEREFGVINQAFGETFLELFGGGTARLELEDPEDILNCGIEIKVQPPGKALKTITLLSGGEKAFVAIALYFAILKVRPTPFVVMDEIEAALDDNNVVRFARYMRSVSRHTQFIVITHRRGTMEEADVLYGVTMQEQGVSRLLSINLNDVERELKLD